MSDLAPYLILFAIVLGMNLMPAFGPPTWSVIVLYGLAISGWSRSSSPRR